MKKANIERIKTGVPNLDRLLNGGLPRYSVSVFGGTPGTGKTILSQQICFHNATNEHPAIIFNTLSEPTAKTLRYLQQFEFFDGRRIGRSIHFIDLGTIMRTKGLSQAHAMILEHLRRLKPSLVVIDSFKVFEELAGSKEDLRKFTYEVAITLMAWECTGLLLGEFSPEDLGRNPLFSIVDGILLLASRLSAGEQQRFLQVVKMRGTDHDRNAHPLQIGITGLQIFAPRKTVRRNDGIAPSRRVRLGISNLDGLLGKGIPSGSSLLLAGVTGSGKSLLALEAIYRGARSGEKGLYFSFEQTPASLLATARSFGWNLEREIKRGMVEIAHIPQPDILIEQNLSMIQEKVQSFGAKRVVIDSISIFLHKVAEAHQAQEKIYQLATVIQAAGAIGLFVTDVPYGVQRISRFGVEDTIVDGVILLSFEQQERDRQRLLEIYKLRNTAHSTGRHTFKIRNTGFEISGPPRA